MYESVQSVVPFLSDAANSCGISLGNLIGYILAGIVLSGIAVKHAWRAGKWTAVTSYKATYWGYRKVFPKPVLSDVTTELLCVLSDPSPVFDKDTLACGSSNFVFVLKGIKPYQLVVVRSGGEQDCLEVLSDYEKRVIKREALAVANKAIDMQVQNKRRMLAKAIQKQRRA